MAIGRAWSFVSACSLGLGVLLGTKYEKYRSVANIPVVFAATDVTDGGHDLPIPVSDSVIRSGEAAARISSEITRLGLPSLENLRSFDDFILSYDRRHRNANWVFEHITRDKLKYGAGVTRDKCEFQSDAKIHPFFAATNDDFRNSGYDRGHLAAAANHGWSQHAMQQTFTLSNMSPQVGKGFNRDIWNQLEKFVRYQAKKHRNVYVCTGPLYLPRMEEGRMFVKYEVIGRNHVAVPTHFFKVLLLENETGAFELISFLLPNQAINEEAKLRQYVVPIEAIERASGLLIFDKLQRKSVRQNNLQLLNNM